MKLNEVETLKDILDRNCHEAKASTVSVFRGMYPKTHDEGESFVGTVRTDRRPRSSVPESVKIFDKLMELNGWGFRKSNTLSVAQQPDIAARYGSVYQIYPFDGALYLGSTRYEDFISIPMKIRVMWGRSYTPLHPPPRDKIAADAARNNPIDIVGYMEQNLEELTNIAGLFVSNSLEDMQPAVGEILVLGTKYVAVDARRHSQDMWKNPAYKGVIKPGTPDGGTYF